MTIQVGNRVVVNNFFVDGIEGTVSYIHHNGLTKDDFSRPIQIELDRPYDEHGQTIIRANLQEIKEVADMKEAIPIEIWTDGSSSNNKTRCGGWSCVLIYETEKNKLYKEMYGGGENETNQSMEMTGVIKGLEQLKSTTIPVRIFTDSAYIVNCFKQGWINGWKRNGWRNSSGDPVANKELWIKLESLLSKQKDASFVKVKGHVGIHYNEIADKLAVKGRYEVEEQLGLR